LLLTVGLHLACTDAGGISSLRIAGVFPGQIAMTSGLRQAAQCQFVVRLLPGKLRWIVLIAALAYIGRFFLSIRFWIMILRIGDGLDAQANRYLLVNAGPAVLLFSLSVVTALLAWKRKRFSMILLMLGLILSGIVFAYETTHGRWQIQAMTEGENCSRFYCTWWWYDG